MERACEGSRNKNGFIDRNRGTERGRYNTPFPESPPPPNRNTCI